MYNDSFFYYLCILSVDSDDIQRILGIDLDTQKRSSAIFVLKMKEKHHLTQIAINDIVEGSRSLFQKSVKMLKAGVEEKLCNAGVETNSVEGLQEQFLELTDPYNGLETEYFQEKYFRDELGLIVRNTFVVFSLSASFNS